MSKLIIILGDRGSGKTLLLARFLLKSRTPFFSNFKVFEDKGKTILHHNYNELHPEQLLHLQPIQQKIGITEAYEYFESRLGMGSFQRYMSYTVFQSRKRYFDYILDTQLDDTIDHRVIRLCDYIIIAEAEDYGFHYYCTDKKKINEFDITFAQAEKFWDYYDSWEIVMTPQIEELGKQIEVQQNKPKLKEKLKELEEKFNKEYKNIEQKKITHAVIENFLLDCDESEVYEPYLYARLQKPK